MPKKITITLSEEEYAEAMEAAQLAYESSRRVIPERRLKPVKTMLEMCLRLNMLKNLEMFAQACRRKIN